MGLREQNENSINARAMVKNKPLPPRVETLSLLKSQGVTDLVFRCRKTTCTNSKTIPIDRFSEHETLGELAVRAKCTRCGRLNCGISPKYGKRPSEGQ